MKKIILLMMPLLILLACHRTNGEDYWISPQDIDSVIIIFNGFETFTTKNISRYEFLDTNLNTKSISIIKNRNSIKELWSYINVMEIVSDSDYLSPSPDELEIKVIKYKQRNVVFINDLLDVRCLLVLCGKNKYFPIWMSQFYVDYNNARYYLSPEMRNFIESNE